MTKNIAQGKLLSRSLRALAFVGLIAVLVLVVIAMMAASERDPLAVPTLAQEEAAAQLVALGETAEWSVPAFQRRWWDYFRPTRGVLVATERRLLFVGLVPEPINREAANEPPALERASFVIDSVSLVVRRTGIRGGRGIEIAHPEGRSAIFAIHPRAWQRAESLMVLVAGLQRQRDAEAEAARLAREEAEAEADRALHHRVERGETLISIAGRYGLTTDSLTALNTLMGGRLRAGDSLLVRPERPGLGTRDTAPQ